MGSQSMAGNRVVLPSFDAELEGCETEEQIDAYFASRECKFPTVESRCERLISYMGIKGVFRLGTKNCNIEHEFLLLKETFCDGNWRYMSGREYE